MRTATNEADEWTIYGIDMSEKKLVVAELQHKPELIEIAHIGGMMMMMMMIYMIEMFRD
jgi:hypothetical protein